MKTITNRFELALVATVRARQIAQGGTPMVDSNRDKPTVIACAKSLKAKSGGDPQPRPALSSETVLSSRIEVPSE